MSDYGAIEDGGGYDYTYGERSYDPSNGSIYGNAPDPNKYMLYSIVSLILCPGWLFAILALIASFLASNSAKEGDMKRTESTLNIAKILIILQIISGSLVYICFFGSLFFGVIATIISSL